LAQVSRGSPFIAFVHLSCVSPSGMAAAGYVAAAPAGADGVGIGWSDTQAYLAVSRDRHEQILTEGYKCRTRPEVPVTLQHDMRGAVQAMKKYKDKNGDKDAVVLEVHGLPKEKIDYEKNKIKTKHLDSSHLRLGIFAPRATSHYVTVPCPICDQMIPDVAGLRGKPGQAYYVGDGNAFMVTPCTNANCLQAQQARQDRLDDGETVTLYHQTSSAIAQRILESGGKMCRGENGAVGGGIYLAQTPKETEWKTEHHGVVLECTMKIGNIRKISQHDKKPVVGITFASLIKEKPDPFDSVLLDRGKCLVAGIHKGDPSGYEYVAYSWDQVHCIRAVDRDKRTCDCCKNKPDKPY